MHHKSINVNFTLSPLKWNPCVSGQVDTCDIVNFLVTHLLAIKKIVRAFISKYYNFAVLEHCLPAIVL